MLVFPVDDAPSMRRYLAGWNRRQALPRYFIKNASDLASLDAYQSNHGL